MARKSNIAEHLALISDDDNDTAAPARAPTKKAAAKKATQRPRKKGSGSRSGSTAKKATAAEATESTSTSNEQIRVLGVANEDAVRVSLYLHPEDHRALGMAKLEDRADANARIRAMIALWRHNDRFRAQVDRLARTAPRGGDH
ncbi:MAG: hypothetical protein GEV04_18150 [Actinophytocola sp.]|nr:hypothetical protein [Actinophytocola sp.]